MRLECYILIIKLLYIPALNSFIFDIYIQTRINMISNEGLETRPNVCVSQLLWE